MMSTTRLCCGTSWIIDECALDFWRCISLLKNRADLFFNVLGTKWNSATRVTNLLLCRCNACCIILHFVAMLGQMFKHIWISIARCSVKWEVDKRATVQCMVHLLLSLI